MKNPHKDKAIVLGVGPEKGLGAALCQRFANEGLHVFVGGRTIDKINAVAETIQSSGGTATALLCDATVEDEVVRLFDAAASTGNGQLKLCVFNVGNNMPGMIKELQAEYFEEAWRSVCFSGFLFGREAARAMLPDGGTLLFTGASASLRGKPNYAAFNSAKSALRAFSQALAKEHAADGLHVGHVIIDGAIAGDKILSRRPDLESKTEKLIALEGLTDAYWFLHQQQRQSWSFELDVRTSLESW